MWGGVRSFHEFLQHVWRLDRCSVCFLKLYLHSRQKFMCMECESLNSLWFCLICGHVACNSPGNIHSREHFLLTKHNFSASFDDFKVYDHELQQWGHDPKVGGEEYDSFTLNTPSHTYSRCCCKVCLYKKTPRLFKSYVCMDCDITQSHRLWLCMTCGHVGCDRNSKCHAFQHYVTSGHPQVSNLVSMKIWDYPSSKSFEQTTHVPDSPLIEIEQKNAENSEKRALINNDGSEVASSKNSPQSSITSEFKQMHDVVVQRVDEFEKQLQDLGRFSPPNRQISIIEDQLLEHEMLNRMLRRKICEHKSKINNLHKQISARKQIAETRSSLSRPGFLERTTFMIAIILIAFYLYIYI